MPAADMAGDVESHRTCSDPSIRARYGLLPSAVWDLLGSCTIPEHRVVRYWVLGCTHPHGVCHEVHIVPGTAVGTVKRWSPQPREATARYGPPTARSELLAGQLGKGWIAVFIGVRQYP